MKPGDFPLQDNCDIRKPDEAFSWMMVALPHMRGAALPMSSEYLQKVSAHLWESGARVPYVRENGLIVPKYQRQWYLPPGAGDPHWLTNPGTWTKDKQLAEDRKHKPTMVDLLGAMRKADEGNFYAALEEIERKK